MSQLQSLLIFKPNGVDPSRITTFVKNCLTTFQNSTTVLHHISDNASESYLLFFSDHHPSMVYSKSCKSKVTINSLYVNGSTKKLTTN